MSQSLVKNYLHLVFSTKYRQELILPSIENELHHYLGGICKNLDCQPIIVGGYVDHIHILCLLSKKIPLSKLLEDVKSGSSKWIKTKGKEYHNFYWQNGYGAFSVNPRETDIVTEYIKSQKAHHKKTSFKEEYRNLLKEFKVDYDERYVWD